MVTELEKRYKERQIIKKETRGTIIVSLAMMATTCVMALAAYLIKLAPVLEMEKLETFSNIINLIVIMLTIGILAIRRTIYFSPRFIKEDFNLEQVLRKWKGIDTVLLSISAAIPVTGLILTLLGMPFQRTFHFFLASAILMLILMPIGLKVRSKLSILRQTHPKL